MGVEPKVRPGPPTSDDGPGVEMHFSKPVVKDAAGRLDEKAALTQWTIYSVGVRTLEAIPEVQTMHPRTFEVIP